MLVCNSISSVYNAVYLPLIETRPNAQISDAISLLSASQIHQQCSSTEFSVCSSPVRPTTTTQPPQMVATSAQVISVSLHLAPSPSFNLASSEPEGTTTAATDQQLKLSTEVIAFIVVGSVLFVTLVVLVFVLIACVCSNRGSSVSKAAEIASIGTYMFLKAI